MGLLPELSGLSLLYLSINLSLTRSLGDGIHHQTQNILRNTTSPFSAAGELALVAIRWRTVETRSRIIRPLFLAVVPFVIAIGFIFAGIESTRVSTGEGIPSEVKVKPQNCGQSLWTPSNTTLQNVGFAFWLAATGQDARAYVDSCYGNATVPLVPLACTGFAADQINYYLSLNQSCPFEESICLTGPQGSISIDTNLFSFHEVLGINAPQSNRVFARNVATCSILDSSNYSNYSTSIDSDGSNTTTHYLYFGPNVDNDYTYAYVDAAAVDGFGYEIQ